MIETLKPYLGEAVTAIVTVAVLSVANRKKNKIDNQQAIVALYQDSLTDLKNRYEEKYQDLKATFDMRLSKVLEEVEGLRRSLNDWRKKYFALKKDFDNYKKEHP